MQRFSCISMEKFRRNFFIEKVLRLWKCPGRFGVEVFKEFLEVALRALGWGQDGHQARTGGILWGIIKKSDLGGKNSAAAFSYQLPKLPVCLFVPLSSFYSINPSCVKLFINGYKWFFQHEDLAVVVVSGFLGNSETEMPISRELRQEKGKILQYFENL